MPDETPHALPVAVLGTGTLGSAMARALSAAGLAVRAWNRTAQRARPLAGHGVAVAATPDEAVRGAGTVLTVLSDGPATLDVMRAAAPGLAEGTCWLQAGTVGPEGLVPLVDFAGERGLRLVETPVLATGIRAGRGELTMLAAGPGAVRERVAPVLDALGATRWLGEEPGAAGRLKLVADHWMLTLLNGTAETLALAEGLGVDPGTFLGAVAGGPLDATCLQTKARLVLEGAWEAAVPLAVAREDADLICRAARTAGVRLDAMPAVAERLRRAEAQGHGGDDAAASFYAAFAASDYGRGDARGSA